MNGLANLRALRPMRILLVTDDTRYADEVLSAAAAAGVHVDLVTSKENIEVTALRTTPNVVVLDAHDRLTRTARAATVFAALHPSILVVLVAVGGPERTNSNLRVFDKWRAAERLLDELARAHVGLPRNGSSA
jgi:AmiR/NasT family two-component response regulator